MTGKNLIYILAVFCLFSVCAVWLTTGERVQAQCTTPSSCKTCHEVQGQKPVSSTTDWHRQHAVFDFCETCHGGDRLAEDAASAHLGMRLTLAEMSTTCKSCHPTELDTCLRTYAGILGIGEEDFDLILESASSTPLGGASLLEQIQSGTLVGPQITEQAETNVEDTASLDWSNPLNIILAVLLGGGVIGGIIYVAWNERRLRRQQKEGLAALSRLVAFVRRENWTPYAAGVLLGLTGILAVLVGKHLLTASGPVATIASSILHTVLPAQAGANMYFRFVVPPELNWSVVLFIGIFFGGMLGALSSGTLRLRWNDDPVWRKVFGRSTWKRILLGFVGALFLQYGASIAGGCTSGLAISGGMLLTPSAFLFMAGMFISGIITAWLIYRRRY